MGQNSISFSIVLHFFFWFGLISLSSTMLTLSSWSFLFLFHLPSSLPQILLIFLVAAISIWSFLLSGFTDNVRAKFWNTTGFTSYLLKFWANARWSQCRIDLYRQHYLYFVFCNFTLNAFFFNMNWSCFLWQKIFWNLIRRSDVEITWQRQIFDEQKMSVCSEPRR